MLKRAPGPLKSRVARKNQRAVGAHIRSGGGIVAAAVLKAPLTNFKIQPRHLGAVHAPALKNDPHIVPVKRFIVRKPRVAPDAADGAVHPRLGGKLAVNLQHARRQGAHQLLQGRQHQPAVILLVRLKPCPAVVQPVLK